MKKHLLVIATVLWISGCGLPTDSTTSKISFEETDTLEIGQKQRVEFRPAANIDAEVGTGLRLYIPNDGGASFRLSFFPETGNAKDVPLGVRVEGPLPDFGDYTAPGAGKQVTQFIIPAGKTAPSEVHVSSKGLYRVLVAPANAFTVRRKELPKASWRLESSCAQGCFRPEVTSAELLKGAFHWRVEQVIEKLALAQIPKILSKEKDVKAAEEKITKIFKDFDPQGSLAPIDRDLALPPLPQLSGLRALSTLLEKHGRPTTEVVQGRFEDLLAPCGEFNRSILPSPIRPDVDVLRYGHFDNLALSRCEYTQSASLSRVLNALGRRNGSFLLWGSQRIETPEALMSEFLKRGYRIEMRNERTYANFASFIVGNTRNLRWPLWLDTGLALPKSGRLVVPMTHSQYTWRVRGPQLQARVVFFLGVHGMGFFPQTDERPHWTGLTLRDFKRSGEAAQDALIVKGFTLARQYMERNERERALLAPGATLPADGYGVLGVCNDTSAALELGLLSTASIFPLARAKDVLPGNTISDALTDLLANLPSDLAPVPATEAGRKALLCRILRSTPYRAQRGELWDTMLRNQMAEAEEYLGDSCPLL